MKRIKIGFSKNKKGKIGSKLLQWYMRKEYSHCYIEFDTSERLDDVTIFHASMNTGVGYWSGHYFYSQNLTTIYYETYISDEMYTQLRKRLHKVSGHNYGFLQNIGILVVDMLNKVGIKVNNPFTDGYNCSEILYDVLHTLVPDYKIKYKPNVIRPDHVEEIIKELKWTTIKENTTKN